MSIRTGAPPNPNELGMTAEEKALAGRPRAAVYYHPPHGDVAKDLASQIRNTPTSDGQRPVTVVLDITRWDGKDLEDVHSVFIMRGLRDATLTRFYQQNLPGVDIFYIAANGAVLDDRPEEIVSTANPFKAFAEARRSAPSSPSSSVQEPSGSLRSPADQGIAGSAHAGTADAAPLPIDEERGSDGSDSRHGSAGAASGTRSSARSKKAD